MQQDNQSEDTDMFELGIEEDTFTMTTEHQTDELLDCVFDLTTTESTSSHEVNNLTLMPDCTWMF